MKLKPQEVPVNFFRIQVIVNVLVYTQNFCELSLMCFSYLQDLKFLSQLVLLRQRMKINVQKNFFLSSFKRNDFFFNKQLLSFLPNIFGK